MAEESTSDPQGGYSAAYRKAAAAGTAILSDSRSGMKIDHTMSYNDPTIPLRKRIAARIAKSVQDIENPKCIDVACSMAGDLGHLKEALGGKPAQLFGIDLLEAQLVKARENLPEAKFTQGDVLALPYGDAEFDSVQTSRLLVHIPDFRKAIDEMIRIMKPGAIGVFSEGEMDQGMLLLTSDDRLRSVHQKKTEFTAKMCANPRAASNEAGAIGVFSEGEMDQGMMLLTSDDRLRSVHQKKTEFTAKMCANPRAASNSYKCLLIHADVEDVTMESFSAFLFKPTDMFGNMDIDAQGLKRLVENGTLTQEDMDYYLAEATGRSANEGNFVQQFCG
eukprot:CAMPEP_0172778956 /NCGR_PEP_ID=MMETSP1074-20121228/202175_1 /TAXON_ID=2916 /ORGANISM="Ceratium fusus, Strain PA161109" /LENGTH=333 /DNA_ID=CAMNT_0013615909 /DNA_START=58 /DNA_END=1056 /DNA_ORIENTATION=+